MQNFKALVKNKTAALIAVGAAATVSLPAFAADVDVGEVVSALKAAQGPIAAIGGASLIVMVGIKVYKWVRRAM